MKRKKVYEQEQIERFFNLLKIFTSLVFAIAIIMIVVLIISSTPGKAFRSFFIGPLDSPRHLGTIMENMTPLLFTGVATCLLFASGEVVLGGEGSLFLGAFLTAIVTTKLQLPNGIAYILVSLLASMLGGMVVSAVSIIAKNKFNAEPFVFSLLFNYIVYYSCNYLLNYKVKDPAYIGIATYAFASEAKFPSLIKNTSVSIAFFIGLAVVLVGWFIMYKTKLGYRASLVKNNRNYAVNMGVNASKVALITTLIGGAIAGLGGCMEMLGKFSRFYWMQGPGYGWDGFMLVTLSNNNPIFIPFAAFFLGYIRTGATVMNIFADIPYELINAIQAIMVLMIASKGMFGKLQQRITRENAERRQALKDENAEKEVIA